MDDKQKSEMLKQSDLFSGLSDKYIKQILAQATTNTYAADDIMVEENDPEAIAFYLILEGRAQVTQADNIVSSLEPGDYFGEVALLAHDNTPRTARVTATEPTTCLVLVKWSFQAMVKSHPELSFIIMGTLARRLSETHRAMS
jgi:CRP-like cAMP-binding protein